MSLAMAVQLEGDEEAALKAKIRTAFSILDSEGRNACDVREVIVPQTHQMFVMLSI